MPNDLQVMEFDTSKLELIKRTVAKGATQDEFELFLHACKRTGLDPLMKQIHAIKRWNVAEQRETMAIQTGIDGYRLVADRTGKYAGSDDAVFEEKDGKPIKATVTVWKMVEGQRVPFTASARFEEYAQKKKDGSLTSFWVKMSYSQLAKCAESLALRKAFPAELSGVYTHDEMMQADAEPVKPALIIPDVRPQVGNRDFGGTASAVNTDKYTGEPMSPPSKPPAIPKQEEDGAGHEGEPTIAEAPLSPHRSHQQASDAPPAIKAASPSEFARQMADKMTDQFEDGLIGNIQPYQGTKPYQKGCRPGYFDLEDGQGGLVRKFKYLDPDLDISSGLKRVYYRTENYQGRTSYAVTKIEALD